AAITSKAVYQKLEKRIREGANIKFEIKHRVRLAEAARASIGKPLSLETKLTPQDFAAIVNSNAASERIFASIHYANLPATSDFSVRLFVTQPNKNRNTQTEHPPHVGFFAFFGAPPPGATPAPPTPPPFRPPPPAARGATPAPSPTPTPSEHRHP